MRSCNVINYNLIHRPLTETQQSARSVWSTDEKDVNDVNSTHLQEKEDLLAKCIKQSKTWLAIGMSVGHFLFFFR